jgi:saccharopine dehydrogenase-like NADP-dependent oxidoreductase
LARNDDELKEMIQSYSSDANGLKLREQREFSFIDRMVDPITTSRFEYKYFQKIGNTKLYILNNKIISDIKVPDRLNIVNENTFDWNNYLSILGMLRTIRESTDENYIIPTQTKCIKLIDLVRKYLKENNELKD